MSERPRVWLLGDSIRMSYQSLVARDLDAVAEVVGPRDNCQYSLFTLSSIDRWMGEIGKPEIVHWNNCLHDVGHNPNRFPVQIPLEMYVANIAFILQRLQTLTPRVVWATATPVHPDRPFREDTWSWRNEEIDRYNAAALELMNRHSIPINDLHAVVAADLEGNLAEDQLHLSTAGQQACAAAVVRAIRPLL